MLNFLLVAAPKGRHRGRRNIRTLRAGNWTTHGWRSAKFALEW